jgi:hypothetical protein
MDSEYERVNETQYAQFTSEQTQRHLAAQVSVLETVCLALCSQSAASDLVLARIREAMSTCSKANSSRPHPDWPIQEHYLGRFMSLVEDQIGAP